MNKNIISKLGIIVLISLLATLRIEKSMVSAAEGGGYDGMGNPAAVYCRELGYDFFTEKSSAGERGFCQLPEGEKCEGWSFLQGSCGSEFSYCHQLGYQTEVRDLGSGSFLKTQAVCLDEQGKEIGPAVELMDLQEKSLGCSVEEMGIVPMESGQKDLTEIMDGDPPSSFDWRSYQGGNWLTGIRDQRLCGSCWAFAAVGAVEAAHNISAGNPDLDLNLSEQYLVADCHTYFGYQHCCGGIKEQALSFIRDSGIPDESCMPYVDGSSGYDGSTCKCDTSDICDGGCQFNSGGECSDTRCSDRCGDWDQRLTNIASYGSVGTNPATIKNTLVTYGPLTASMEWEGFGGFDGDVYRCASDDTTNHAVVIVGYDDTGQYWLVRNSWGTGFGDSGYFKIGYGECRIESKVAYALNNQQPDPPSSPSPADGASGVALDSNLSWTGSDPNPGDELTYDVFLEADNNPPSVLVCDDTSQTSCTPGSLQTDTQYYFQVIAEDPYGETASSPVWSFSTESGSLSDTIGQYDPATSIWYLKPENTGGWDGVNIFKFGPAGGGRIPLSGDWDGDGLDTVGHYDPVTSIFYLKPANVGGWVGVNIFKFGPEDGGRIPVVGDWDGDGVDTIGQYDPATSMWYLKSENITGWDGVNMFKFGPAGGGRLPLVGDWDGDGIDSIGQYDPVTSIFYLKPANVGGWDGVNSFKYGPAAGGRTAIAGDWDGNGTDTIGQYDPVSGIWYLKPENTGGWTGVEMFKYGPAGDVREPLDGRWE